MSEYDRLREEITARIQLRHQMEVLAVAILGAILAFAAQTGSASALFAYPYLVVFIALGWRHNSNQIYLLGKYIYERYEVADTDVPWWEHWIRGPRSQRIFARPRLSAMGIFLGSQIAALVTACDHVIDFDSKGGWGAFWNATQKFLFTFEDIRNVWVYAGILAIVATFVVLRFFRMRD